MQGAGLILLAVGGLCCIAGNERSAILIGAGIIMLITAIILIFAAYLKKRAGARERQGRTRGLKDAEKKVNGQEPDIIIKAAAVADYTPVTTADSKIKKSDGDMKIELKRTKDILKHLGQNRREGQFICGFSMETDNVIENSRKKLASKNVDMICANSLRTAGAGFGTDTNVITMITADGDEEMEIMSKFDAANVILSKILQLSK